MKAIVRVVFAAVLIANGVDAFAEEASLKYFGFYKNVDVGQGDAKAIATVPYSNVAWITGGAGVSPQAYADAIRRMDCLGMHAVLEVRDVFFVADSNETWTMRSDWEDRWLNLASAIAPVIGNIAAFYIFDEPIREKGIGSPYLDSGRTLLQTGIDAVRARFPGTPVAMVYADTNAPTTKEEVDNKLLSVRDIDWFGIDCYTLYPVNCNGKQYGTVIEAIEEFIDWRNSGQRLMLIPQSFLLQNPDCGNDASCEPVLSQVLQYTYDLANRPNSKVIGLFPYAYFNFTDSAGKLQRGFEGLSAAMPEYTNSMKSVGATISAALPVTGCKKTGPAMNTVFQTLLHDGT